MDLLLGFDSPYFTKNCNITKWQNFDPGTRDKSLKSFCLNVIAANVDSFLYHVENGHLPHMYYEYLQKTSSHELLYRLTSTRDNLSKMHIDFFLNPYLKYLSMNVFSPSICRDILDKLRVIGKTITCFRLTKFVYPKTILLDLIHLIPNVQFLCLDKTRCSNKVLKTIADHCPHLRTLDVSQCFDITDEGIYAFCHSEGSENVVENSVLEELDVWSTAVTIRGIMFAIQNLTHLKRLQHYLLYRALCRKHLFTFLESDTNSISNIKTYRLKELTVHPGDICTARSLQMCTVLCPHVTCLRVFGIKSQAEIDACGEFTELTKVHFVLNRDAGHCSLTPFVMARGGNLTEIIAFRFKIVVQSLLEYCPKLEVLQLESCEFDGTDELTDIARTHSFRNLKKLTLGETFYPVIPMSVFGVLFSSPKLEQLILSSCFIPEGNSFIDYITQLNLFPNLRALEITRCGIVPYDVERLLSSISTLKKVHFNQIHPSMIDRADIFDMADRFLDVEFSINGRTVQELRQSQNNDEENSREVLWGYGFDYADDYESEQQYNSNEPVPHNDYWEMNSRITIGDEH